MTRGAAQALVDALAIPSAQHTIQVDGVAIRYRRWAGPAGGAGRPVLLVHGMFAHARWWDAVAGWLGEDRAVAAIDLSGMGDSGWREDYSRDQHAREILAVARDLAFAAPWLVAHSYGGDPSIRSCLAEPGLFHGLVLLDSRLRLNGVPEYEAPRDPVVSDRRVYPGFADALARFRLLPPTVHPDPVMLDHIARHSLVETGSGWGWKFDRRLGNAPAGPLDPGGLVLPVAFIRGAESDVTPPDQMARTREHLPGARFLSLPGAGHHLMVDQPLALAATLRGLFAEP